MVYIPPINLNLSLIFAEDLHDLDNKVFLKTLGERINFFRKEKGLSFQELAYLSEIDKSNLLKLVKQGTNLTTLSLLKLSKALQIPLSEIFNFDYDLDKTK